MKFSTIKNAAGNGGLFTDGDWILSENMDANGKVAVIQLKHIGVNDFLRKPFTFISEQTFRELKCTEVSPGDILISRMADPIARACILPPLPFKCVTAVDISILRTDQTVGYAPYLKFVCNSDLVRRQAESATRGTTRARVTRTELGQIKIPLPAIDEQKRIAELLGKADRLRRTRRYVREISGKFLQAVFLQMFGRFLKNGDFVPMGEVVAISGGGTPARAVREYYTGRIPWVTAKDMRGLYISDAQEHITEQAVRSSATKLVPPDSILVVVKSKVLMHRLPVALTRRELCHNQDIKSLQCSPKVDPLFLLYVIRHNEANLLQRARGANTEGLTLPMLEEIKVPVIPKDEQQEFADIVRRVERLRAQQSEADRQAEHLFQALLHRAFPEDATALRCHNCKLNRFDQPTIYVQPSMQGNATESPRP